MKKLEEIQKQIERLQLEESQLLAERFHDELLPQIEMAIGRTFVYRNDSYGSGGRWDSFRKVLAVAFSTYRAQVVYQQCQIDYEGRASIQHEVDYVGSRGTFPHSEGWKPCPRDEYERAYQAALSELHNPTLLIKNLEKKALP